MAHLELQVEKKVDMHLFLNQNLLTVPDYGWCPALATTQKRVCTNFPMKFHDKIESEGTTTSGGTTQNFMHSFLPPKF